MFTALQRSLIATLAYFDLFDYPLNFMELQRYRYCFSSEEKKPTVQHILEALHSADEKIAVHDGFWHLTGRDSIVRTRQRRYRLAEPKFSKACRVSRWLSFIPSVRLVAVCNSLALSNADAESDIDLFVVVRPGFLWVTRFIVVSALTLLGHRPNRTSHADKVCMSFFVSENALDLSGVAVHGEDVYLHYWIASLIPLYDAGGIFAAFLAKNSWIQQRIPGALFARRSSTITSPRWGSIFLPILRAAEPLAKKIQRRLFPAEIRMLANHDSRVVISDDMLKFHVIDRRKEFQKKFYARLHELDISTETEVQTEVERVKEKEIAPL